MDIKKCEEIHIIWAILTNPDVATKAGDNFKSHILSSLSRLEREIALTKMVLVVNNSNILSKLINDNNESAILKIFANIFEAYYEWLDKDLSKINISKLVYTILDNFEILDNNCSLKRNYKKDYLLECFCHISNKNIRTNDKEEFEKIILETLKSTKG